MHALSPYLLAAAITIPGFLLGPIVAALLPTLAGLLQSVVGTLIKRQVAWQENVSPWIGEAVNLAVSLVVTVVLVRAGVSISAATLACVKNPATQFALECVDANTIANIVQGALTYLSTRIGAKTAVQHAEWRRATFAQRAAGVGRGA